MPATIDGTTGIDAAAFTRNGVPVVLGGRVSGTGANTYSSPGVSTARNSVGDFTVTHGRNSIESTPVVTVESTQAFIACVYDRSLNSFSYRIRNASGTLTDGAASWLLIIP